MLATSEYGKVKFSRDVDLDGICIMATVEFSGTVIDDGTEGTGWGRRVDFQYDPELKACEAFVGGERMPKCVERLMCEHLHDQICELVRQSVGSEDVEAAIRDAA